MDGTGQNWVKLLVTVSYLRDGPGPKEPAASVCRPPYRGGSEWLASLCLSAISYVHCQDWKKGSKYWWSSAFFGASVRNFLEFVWKIYNLQIEKRLHFKLKKWTGPISINGVPPKGPCSLHTVSTRVPCRRVGGWSGDCGSHTRKKPRLIVEENSLTRSSQKWMVVSFIQHKFCSPSNRFLL